MTAYALAEWRLWKTVSLRKTVPLVIVPLFVSSLMPFLQAFLLNAVFCAVSIALGWNYGRRFHPGNSFRLLAEGHAERTVFGGRFISSVMIWSFFMFLGSPFLVFVSIAWMLPLSVVSLWILAWFSTFILATGLALLSSMLSGSSDHALGAYVTGLWLLPGIFFAPARAINPFFQTWSYARGSSPILPLLGIVLETGLAALAFIGSARVMAARRRRGRD